MQQSPVAPGASAGPHATAGPAPQSGGPGTTAYQRHWPPQVKSIAQTEVITVEPDTPVRTVVTKMAEANVGSVVVVDDGSPIGVLTDRAIALSLKTDDHIAERRAADLVSGEIITGTFDMTLADALGRLQETGVRRLPLLDDEDSLAGIVTLDDILIELGHELKLATSIIETQTRS